MRVSKLETLPVEIFFEIFDYLNTFDLFSSWIHLNHRLNTIVYSYPIELDFQHITRRKFDFLCRSIHPKQVTSLYLSEELMPEQIQLFQQYFPSFSKQFLSLEKLKFIDTSTIFPSLPSTLSSLSIKTYLKTNQTDQLILRILQQQHLQLTDLELDGSYAFRSIEHSFPCLTHLTFHYCTVTEFDRILQRIQSPLISLKIFFDKEDHFLLPNFHQLTTTLTNLNVHFCEELTLSFRQIIDCISKLLKLQSLTIRATGHLDLFDGPSWEDYLSRTGINKFHFKFSLANHLPCSLDKQSLLQSFRSSFWLDKHHWYVACEKGQLRSSRPIIYSIPYFQLPFLFYPTNTFLPVSTVENEDLRLSKQSVNLILTFHQTIIPPKHPFPHVSTLTLLTPWIPSIDTLQSIVHLEQIEELDVSLVKFFSIEQFQNLLEQMSHLKTIKMQYHPFYYPPLHIHSYIFIRRDKEMSVLDENNIQRFIYLFFHLKFLEITIQSKDLIIQLLNQLHYLERIKIFCYQNYFQDLKKQWFHENIPRLKTIQFSYRITSSYLFLAIGDSKNVHTGERITKKIKYKSCSRCNLQ